jgi:SAM-dependent methyltransferase
MATLETLSSCPLCEGSCIVHVDEAFLFDRCASCGFVFDNPRLTQASIAEHYSRLEQYDGWLQNLDARNKLCKRRLSKMLPDIAQGSLIDIGAGIGQFLAIAQSSFSSVRGIELSESAVRIAKKYYGLSIDHGTIEELHLPTFDNLTMIHVLEHVINPKDTLKRCYDILNPKGRLFICVPNDLRAWSSKLSAIKSRIRSILYAINSRIGNSNYSPITGLARGGTEQEIHLSHFTRETLVFAVRQAGFKVLKVDIDPYYAATGWRLFVNHLSYAVHKLLYLPTYQTLWLVAEKP